MKKSLLLATAFFLFLHGQSQTDSTAAYPFNNTFSFQVQPFDKVVQLKWSIDESGDIKGFDIERADDGQPFIKVGSRLSINRNSRADYDFVDATPRRNADMLYRVKVLGRDGSQYYSQPKQARIDDSQLAVRLRQNPVQSSLELEIAALETGKASVTIVSSAGQPVLTQAVKLTPGGNPVSLSVSALAGGIYQLVVEAGKSRKIISFVKE